MATTNDQCPPHRLPPTVVEGVWFDIQGRGGECANGCGALGIHVTNPGRAAASSVKAGNTVWLRDGRIIDIDKGRRPR